MVDINIEKAISALQGGNPVQAKTICEKLLNVRPDNAVVLQVLGLACYQVGHIDTAINHLKRSMELDPTNSWVSNNIASILQQENRIEEALPYAKKAIEIDSRNADAINNLGMIYRKQHEYKKAEDSFTRAIRLDKNNPMYLVNLGELYIQIDRPDDAERVLRKALLCDPNSISAKNNLGTILQKKGDVEAALKIFMEVIDQVPEDADVLNNIGIAHYKLHDLRLAKEFYQRAINADDKYAPAYVNLVDIYLDLADKEKAIELCKSAIAADNNFFPARIKLADIYKTQDRFNQSVREITKVIGLDPNYIEGYIEYAEILEHFGKLDLAEKQLVIAADISGESNSILLNQAAFAERSHQLDSLKNLLDKIQPTNTREEKDKILLEAKLCRRSGKFDDALILLDSLSNKYPEIEFDEHAYLIAKAQLYDKLKNYDQALDYYERAAKLRHIGPDLGFNEERSAAAISNQIKFFNKQKIDVLPQIDVGEKLPVSLPIFIVGFPRSGTTLLEQILCSHSKIIAGDELNFLNNILDRMPTDLETDDKYPFCLEVLINSENQQEILYKWREQYFAQAEESGLLSSSALYFTDKMPLNLNYLPLIKMIFPDCPIIHMMRNPMDSVLSSVFSGFSNDTNWAHDLTDASQYFMQTVRLANHIIGNLDLNYMLLRYEDLVAEQETWSRKVIDFIGIEWDDKCLHFYETKRVSKTASYDQVTQKIYRSSVTRYKNYEKFLSKQLEILKPAMEQFGYLD